MSDYPALDELDRNHGESQIIAEFIEWLEDQQGLAICSMRESNSYNGDWFPDRRSTEQLLADFFEKKEKRVMIKRMKEKN